MPALCLARPLLLFAPLLFRCAGALVQAAAARGRSPLPAHPQQPQQPEQGVGSGPKPAVLPESEERNFVGRARLLPRRLLPRQLLPLELQPLELHLLLQPHHLLPVLRLTQEGLRGRVWRVINPQRVLQDAEHGQDLGDAQSHGLQEEGEKGVSRAGREGDGGWHSGAGDAGAQQRL